MAVKKHLFHLIIITLILTFGRQQDLPAQPYRNASDFNQPEPLAGFKELRTSQELYLFWAQDNIFKNQIVDYFPTPQPAAALLAGDITDVFTPSKIETGNPFNNTTRTSVVAADIDDNGLDELIKVTSTNAFDLLLTITEVASDLEVTGNSVTMQIQANLSKNFKSRIKVLAGNFDDDAASEIVVVWPDSVSADINRLSINVFDVANGKIAEISSFTFDHSVLDFDVVLSDLDLNGYDEIILSNYRENAGNYEVILSVLGLEAGFLEEKTTRTINNLTPQETLFSNASLALTQGDYDGDVAPEIALAIRQTYPDLRGYRMQVKIFQAVDNVAIAGESVFEELIMVSDQMLLDQPSDFVIDYLPVFAASGDLTGDGNDELTVYNPTTGMLHLIDLDSFTEFPVKALPLERDNNDPIFCFTRGGGQTLSVAIGDLDRDGIEELIVAEAEGCTEDIFSEFMRGARLTCHVYDISTAEEARLAGFYHNNDANTQYFGVLPATFVLGDFNGDNFRLGKGRYFKRSDITHPIILLNAPPIHFDKLGDDLYDINSCYNGAVCAFASTYQRSSTISMKTSTTVSSAWSASVTVEGSVTADAVVVSSSIEASVTGRYGEKFSKFRSSGKRLEISTQVSAIEDDQIYASVSDYDIWEYPVYEKDSLIAHLLSVTPTVLENRWFPSKSFNAFSYLPDHEVGNILSYREMKPEFSSVARQISSDAFTLSANSQNKWTINQQSFSQSGSSFEQEIGIEASAKVETEAEFKIFGGSLAVTVEGEYEEKSLSTHKTRVSEEIEIEVSLGGVNESLGEVKYSVNPYCYWAKNGALVVDYTTVPEVPAPGASDTWWSANYGQKADPALILPWQYDPEKGLTLQDEQVKRFQSKSIGFSNSRPEAGDTVTIYVEVHNWSLLPTANPVEVGFYLCDPTEEENRMEGIDGGTTISTGKVIGPRGNEVLSFAWKVPEGLPTFPRIYARIDPNNLEDEIHEENNFGFNILNISTNRAPCPAPMITSTQDLYNEFVSKIQVFPNPVEDQLTIHFQAIKNGLFKYRLLNSFGQIVREEHQKPMQAGRQKEVISVSSLPSGIYYYQLFFDDGTVAGSVMKR